MKCSFVCTFRVERVIVILCFFVFVFFSFHLKVFVFDKYYKGVYVIILCIGGSC